MESTLKAYTQSLKVENDQLQKRLKEASSKMGQLAEVVNYAMTHPNSSLALCLRNIQTVDAASKCCMHSCRC